jgi:hypothetical protein
MLAPPAGSLPLLRWTQGPLSIPYRPGTPAYMLQDKIKSKVCVHSLPRATAAQEPSSLLREGSGAAKCPRLQTPPLRLGGFRRCHMPKGSGPRLTIQEGSGAAMRPSALSPASPLRRGPTLTCVHRLQTAPASEVGSGADTCPMALHRSWAVEIKEDLDATVCSEAHVFSRHTCALPSRLQDVRVDSVIMIYKSCRHMLHHYAIVHRHTADPSHAWRYSTTPCS